ncbi:nucleotidyltransferase domain-containing protein [Sphingomonas alpina]|uniref:Nucleotidyltransferase family protein n=1 Tax=Sphingomonas alpina TaxID=653931 RepID=A0A7H0LL48_9SPHN|nr:nucleotidyltransferase family protein [Sphingomonas alpina]QNQ10401.1 nucleotidyltransferase family protein [Sphingomonas alpina]
MNDGWLLARALCTPGDTLALDAAGWTDLLAIARAEQMIGTLAHRLAGLPVPKSVARILDDARASAEQGRIIALWEAEMARRVLTAIGVPLVLLKGTAFVAAGLEAGQGRSIGDLDILVPRDRIDAVEAALLAGGWEWVKPDPYDDDYYRRWMHELPPLIHRERDRMIDVHHTILPLTARITPDAGALLAARVALQPGVHGLSPNDMLVHAAAHLFADGDLAGGMRNLWDVHCLVGDFGTDGLAERAAQHGLARETARALRLAAALYGARVRLNLADRLYLRRLTARDGWGWPTRPFTRFGFYVRSHWLRMPPAMLARHLWTKWRKGGAGPASG